MFSAQANDYLVLRKCAADDFIEKPFDDKLLLKKISLLLKTSNENEGAIA